MRAGAITCSAQLSWRSPPRLRRWRCCFPLEASIGLVPARAAKDASLAIRFGSPLETSSCAPQTGPTPGSLSRSGASSATASAKHAVAGTGAGPLASGRAGESLAGEAAKARAHVIRRGHDQRAQLVEGGGARADRTPTFEQKNAQVVALLAATARKAEPIASQQPSRGQRRV